MSTSPVELTPAQRAEPPLHRPRPCPACGRESRAILDGRCLACRLPSESDAAIRTGSQPR